MYLERLEKPWICTGLKSMKITTCTRLKYYLPYYEFKGFMSLYISIAKSVFIMAHMLFQHFVVSIIQKMVKIVVKLLAFFIAHTLRCLIIVGGRIIVVAVASLKSNNRRGLNSRRGCHGLIIICSILLWLKQGLLKDVKP